MKQKKKYLRIVYIFCGMGLQGWFSGLSLDWFLVYERTPGDCFLRICVTIVMLVYGSEKQQKCLVICLSSTPVPLFLLYRSY